MTSTKSPVVEWSVAVVMAGSLIAALVSPQSIAPLVMLFAVVVAVARRRYLDAGSLVSVPGIAALVLLGWALTSLLWSIDPSLSGKRSLRLFLMIAMCVVTVAYIPRIDLGRRAERVLLAVAAAVAGTVIIDGLAGQPLGRLFHSGGDPWDRGGSVIALLVWPLGVIAYRRAGVPALVAVLAVAAVAVALLSNKAALLGTAIGYGCAALTLLRPRAVVLLGCLTVVLFTAAVPLTLSVFRDDVRSLTQSTDVDASIRHRIFIWSFSAEKAMEKPLTGWGMGVSRSVPGSAEVQEFLRADGSVDGRGESLPLHPHNGFLQIYLELGLIGLALALATLLLALGRLLVCARAGGTGPAAVGFTVSAFVMSSISFGAWQGWWVSILLLTATILYGLSRPEGEPVSD